MVGWLESQHMVAVFPTMFNLVILPANSRGIQFFQQIEFRDQKVRVLQLGNEQSLDHLSDRKFYGLLVDPS